MVQNVGDNVRFKNIVIVDKIDKHKNSNDRQRT